jgi:hypothetical protein
MQDGLILKFQLYISEGFAACKVQLGKAEQRK